MASAVKTRRYESPRRRAQAAQTRSEILDAAHRLFSRDGYAATSIAQIATEAQVALNTVYAAFGTKRGVLMALWNREIRGDEQPVPVADRPWFKEVLAETDPHRQIELIARNSRQVKGRAGSVMQILRAASTSDREIGGLWQRMQKEFHANQRLLIEALQHTGGLRPDLESDEATDILWTLNSFDVYHLLVTQRRWTPERYERWLTETLTAQLLNTSD
jgi:AcrR family transcriptional regulator